MKNNKSLLSLGIIALVLFLGVGYAVVNTTNLTIGGTASVQDSQMNVRFSKEAGDTTVSNSEKVVATVTDDLNATIKVSNLAAVNDEVTATYTIQNYDTTLSATISEKNITVTPSGNFEVTTDLKNDSKTVVAGGTTTVTITVKLIKMPVSSDNSSASISVNLTATPVEPTE